MTIDEITSLTSTVGFPILCVIALGVFIYKAYDRIAQENKEREEKLYTLIGKSQEQLDKLEEINSGFVKVLESFTKDNEQLKLDITYIKESIRAVPKRQTDRSRKDDNE